MVHYDTDLINIWRERTAKPLVFDSYKAAEAFSKQYRAWEDIYGDSEKSSCDIIPVNEKFETYLKNLNENLKK